MEWSEKIDKIAPAFLAAQRKFKPAAKSGKNPHFDSEFSELSDIMAACKEALHEHGISILQPAKRDGDYYGVETILLHESGQWLKAPLLLKPVKSDPQGSGSSISYSKRYSLGSMVGVVEASSDDGNAASGKGKVELYNAEPEQTFVLKDIAFKEGVTKKEELLDLSSKLIGTPMSELASAAKTYITLPF